MKKIRSYIVISPDVKDFPTSLIFSGISPYSWFLLKSLEGN